MKKFLSLVLALVMTMSLVVVGASASSDFTDASSIKYPEAVDVVAACKIIDGYADGSFKGTDTLTRGAAAKIICNMVLGPTTASALGADVKPFPDVATNHTFAGYIAYCAQQGIINGYADGNFYPAKTVTGYQFMKMLLGALGYDGKLEGYTGGNWSVNVAKTALGIGLDDGNDDFVGTTAMTREEACLYAFNTIKADLVEYDNNLIINDGQISTSSKAKSMTYSEAGISKNVAMQIVNDEIAQFGEKYFKDLKKGTAGEDDFGRPANEWKYKSESVGTYANSDMLKASYKGKVERGTMYSLLGKSVYNDLVAGDATLSVWTDGVETVVTPATVTSYIQKDSSDDFGGKGDTVEVYLDEDTNDVTVVISNVFLLQASGDYNSSKETLSVSSVNPNYALDSTTIDNDDVVVSSFKDEDYILATAVLSGGRYTVKSAVAAQTVTGTVTAYNNNAAGTKASNVTIAGTKYSYSATAYDVSNTIDYSINEDAKVVLDAQGNIIYVKDIVATSTNYVFVKAAANKTLSDNAVATAYYTDGTTKEITIKKLIAADGTSTTAWDNKTTAFAGKWFTYSTDDNGKYTLTVAEKPSNYTVDYNTTCTANTDVVVNGKVAFAAGMLGNADTIFLVLDKDDDITVYTGVAKVPTITSNAANSVKVYTVAKSGYAKYVFIDAAASKTIDDSTASSDDYVYVLDLKNQYYNTTDKTTQYIYNAIAGNGTEKSTITANTALTTYTLNNKVKTNSKDYITGMSLIEKANSAKYELASFKAQPVTYSAGTMSFGTTTGDTTTGALVMASDAKVYLISAASALNKDKGADYEITYATTAQAAANMLKNYNVTGKYQAIKASTTSNVVNTLYITVTGAVATDANPDAPVINAANYDITVSGLQVTAVHAYGTPTADQILAAVENYLTTNYGTITDESYANPTYTFKIGNKSYTWNTTDAAAVTGYKKVSVDGTSKLLAGTTTLAALNAAADTFVYQTTAAGVSSYVAANDTAITDGYAYVTGYVTVTVTAAVSGTATNANSGTLTAATTAQYIKIGKETTVAITVSNTVSNTGVVNFTASVGTPTGSMANGANSASVTVALTAAQVAGNVTITLTAANAA